MADLPPASVWPKETAAGAHSRGGGIMEVKLCFHYKPKGQEKPNSTRANSDEIVAKSGDPIAIPDVGDTVNFLSDEPGINDFKVLTRHFVLGPRECTIEFAVTDVSDEELATRITG